MAPSSDIEKLRKDIQRLERKIAEVDEEMDVLEVRLLNAKGAKKTALEKKIEKLDLKWEKLDTSLSDTKKQLAAIDPTYTYESEGSDGEKSQSSDEDKKKRGSRKSSGSSGDEKQKAKKTSSVEKSPRRVAEEEQDVKPRKDSVDEKKLHPSSHSTPPKESPRKNDLSPLEKKISGDLESVKRVLDLDMDLEPAPKSPVRKTSLDHKHEEKKEEVKKEEPKVEKSEPKVEKKEEKEEKKEEPKKEEPKKEDVKHLSRVSSSKKNTATIKESSDTTKDFKKKLLSGATMKRREKPPKELLEQKSSKPEIKPESKSSSKSSSVFKTLSKNSKKTKDVKVQVATSLSNSSEESPTPELRTSYEMTDEKREKRKSLFSATKARLSKKVKPVTSNPQLSKPDDGDIDKQFNEFLESIGVKNDKLKELWSQEYKTPKQKLDLLKTVTKNSSKLGSSFNSDVPASVLAQELHQNPTEEALDKLLLFFRTGTVAWIKEFIESDGIKYLFEAFTLELFKLDRKNLSASFSSESSDKFHKFELCITCIEEGVNNSAIGVDILKKNAEVVRNLFLAIEYVSTEQRCAIFELLAAISVMANETHLVVTEAVEYFKKIKLGVFRNLMNELKDGIDLEFKVSFLSFINSIVVMFEDIADRVKTRGLFMSEGLGEMVESLKTDYPDPDLQEQLSAFSEELENDCKEAGCIVEDDLAVDPFAVLSSLWEKMKGSGLELKFLSVMDNLFKIGIPTLASDVWGIIAETTKQLYAIISSSERLESITLEEALLRILGKTQSGAPNVQIFKSTIREPPKNGDHKNENDKIEIKEVKAEEERKLFK